MSKTSVLKNKNASTLERSLAFGGIALAAAGLSVLKIVNPANSNYFPICPFHALTGLNCPGCGATRGIHALLNGDILTALHFNAMLVIFVPIAGYILFKLLSIGFRGRSFSIPQNPRIMLFSLVSLLILLIGFGIVRNLPFYPFNL